MFLVKCAPRGTTQHYTWTRYLNEFALVLVRSNFCWISPSMNTQEYGPNRAVIASKPIKLVNLWSWTEFNQLDARNHPSDSRSKVSQLDLVRYHNHIPKDSGNM